MSEREGGGAKKCNSMEWNRVPWDCDKKLCLLLIRRNCVGLLCVNPALGPSDRLPNYAINIACGEHVSNLMLDQTGKIADHNFEEKSLAHSASDIASTNWLIESFHLRKASAVNWIVVLMRWAIELPQQFPHNILTLAQLGNQHRRIPPECSHWIGLIVSSVCHQSSGGSIGYDDAASDQIAITSSMVNVNWLEERMTALAAWSRHIGDKKNRVHAARSIDVHNADLCCEL